MSSLPRPCHTQPPNTPPGHDGTKHSCRSGRTAIMTRLRPPALPVKTLPKQDDEYPTVPAKIDRTRLSPFLTTTPANLDN